MARSPVAHGPMACLTIASLILVLAGCATFPSVAPGQVFRGPVMVVRAPASPGWHLVESGPGGLSFARHGASANGTVAAQALAMRLPPVRSDAELLATIRTGAERDTPAERFRTIESVFELTSERPYPCVRFRGAFEDLRSRTPQGTVALPMYVRSLYCQHPTQPGLGFMAAYSQRGGPPDPDLDAQARAFIEGVQASGGGRPAP